MLDQFARDLKNRLLPPSFRAGQADEESVFLRPTEEKRVITYTPIQMRKVTNLLCHSESAKPTKNPFSPHAEANEESVSPISGNIKSLANWFSIV